jgi:hypothetical protein
MRHLFLAMGCLSSWRVPGEMGGRHSHGGLDIDPALPPAGSRRVDSRVGGKYKRTIAGVCRFPLRQKQGDRARMTEDLPENSRSLAILMRGRCNLCSIRSSRLNN